MNWFSQHSRFLSVQFQYWSGSDQYKDETRKDGLRLLAHGKLQRKPPGPAKITMRIPKNVVTVKVALLTSLVYVHAEIHGS